MKHERVEVSFLRTVEVRTFAALLLIVLLLNLVGYLAGWELP